MDVSWQRDSANSWVSTPSVKYLRNPYIPQNFTRYPELLNYSERLQFIGQIQGINSEAQYTESGVWE